MVALIAKSTSSGDSFLSPSFPIRFIRRVFNPFISRLSKIKNQIVCVHACPNQGLLNEEKGRTIFQDRTFLFSLTSFQRVCSFSISSIGLSSFGSSGFPPSSSLACRRLKLSLFSKARFKVNSIADLAQDTVCRWKQDCFPAQSKRKDKKKKDFPHNGTVLPRLGCASTFLTTSRQ